MNNHMNWKFIRGGTTLIFLQAVFFNSNFFLLKVIGHEVWPHQNENYKLSTQKKRKSSLYRSKYNQNQNYPDCYRHSNGLEDQFANKIPLEQGPSLIAEPRP